MAVGRHKYMQCCEGFIRLRFSDRVIGYTKYGLYLPTTFRWLDSGTKGVYIMCLLYKTIIVYQLLMIIDPTNEARQRGCDEPL